MASHEHIPVLLKEILENTCLSNGMKFLDGTFGRGGHTKALMEIYPEIQAVGLDRDQDAIDFGEKNYKLELDQGRLKLFHTNFYNSEFYKGVSQDLGYDKFDMILLDLGVSSPQLDNPERGFSFYDNGPLDMRMDYTDPLTAKEIINEWNEEELVHIFQTYGEVYKPFRVVKAILEDRHEKPFESTEDLSSLIVRIEGWKRKGHHPATKYFLALRLVVNKELECVEQALPLLMNRLNPMGRLFVITFHSLEDRIVKNIFKSSLELGRLVNKKVIQAKWDDKKKNPRARSAKLRIFERGEYEKN